MSNTTIMINQEEIIHQIKTSLEIPKVIKDILKRKIVVDTATKYKLKNSEQEIQVAADLIRVVNNVSSASETWSWMEEHWLSLDDFESIVDITLLSQKLATHMFDDKVEKRFFEKSLDYVGASIYEIIFDDEDVALDYFYSIQEGEQSFFEVARQHIQDNELRRACGYRGIVYRNELRPELASAIFSTSEPQILKPVNTQIGSHLILLDSIEKKELNDQVRIEIISEMFNEWMEQQVQDVTFARKES